MKQIKYIHEPTDLQCGQAVLAMLTDNTPEKICEILDFKKAEDITVMDVAELTVIAENFVVATGLNTQHVNSLAENLEDELAKIGVEPIRTEGMREGRWAVLDYGSVIVHIFNDETRLLYSLDKLWGRADNVTKFCRE